MTVLRDELADQGGCLTHQLHSDGYRKAGAVTRMQKQKPLNNAHADTDARTDT